MRKTFRSVLFAVGRPLDIRLIQSSGAAAMSASSDVKSSSKDKRKGAQKFAPESNGVVDAAVVLPGQLKSFSGPMADAYHPGQVESGWDDWWRARGFYQPQKSRTGKTFTIVIPPPNVTGTLHLGHALTVAIQDAITRWHRMSGDETLWVPGTDHAGIATQVVVEKKLMRERGLTRHDIGREAFLHEVWRWKDESGGTINKQIARLGASVDWSRERFTMDSVCSAAVQRAFLDLYRAGLIYRSNRLVNWSCTLRTAISSIEVDHADLDGPTMIKVPGYAAPIEFGVLHSFAYKINDSEGEIVVATTRIETMLGDVAVAVHPADERYQHLRGKTLRHPFVADRKVTVIFDDILVDRSFGTGAVKVTPAHDPNDFKCGERHKLDFINIFNDDGTINANGGHTFQGKKRFDARADIIVELTRLGLYRGKTSNKMALGICSRSKDIVEPVIRPQWWVSCKGMAEAATAAVRSGELLIVPPIHQATWFTWLKDIQDWCISRQLWWGHRIPAYHVSINGREDTDDEEQWIVAESQDAALTAARSKFADVPADDISVRQDEDVLDTWFSSGLFPFSVFGWPQQTEDLARYFPNTLLETGHDILFFWVARMVFMSQSLTNRIPFGTVYLHAMVRDKLGRKMSKSLGNVIDPLDVINGITLDKLADKLRSGNLDPAEVARALDGQSKDFPDGIAECGADALRFGLLAYTVQGRDINLDIQKVVAYRQFGNKLWQATKFALPYFDTQFTPQTLQQIAVSNFADRWILSRLHAAVAKVNSAMAAYSFAECTRALHTFWLYELCDVFLEMSKPTLKLQGTHRQSALNTLHLALHTALRLLHPFMPFITEELYQRLPNATAERTSIMIAPFPSSEEWSAFADDEIESAMTAIQSIAAQVRSKRAALGLAKKVQIELVVLCKGEAPFALVTAHQRELATIALVSNVNIVQWKLDVSLTELGIPGGAAHMVVSPEYEVFHSSPRRRRLRFRVHQNGKVHESAPRVHRRRSKQSIGARLRTIQSGSSERAQE